MVRVEQAILFGRSNSLMGILTRPSSDPPENRPAIVILNSGIVHRTGHHRMYVTIARLLADAGYNVLRFDFSGVGDSLGRSDALSLNDSYLADVSEACELLTSSCGSQNFIFAGLCEGADVALRCGYADDRVVGLILLDPFIPPTARFYVDYIGERLTRLRSWLSFLAGRGRIWQDIADRVRSNFASSRIERSSSRINPRARGELEVVYNSLVAGDVKLLVALTSAPMQGRQTYREQLLDAFPGVAFKEKLRLEYFAGSDHTFSSISDRKKLNDLILEWIAAESFRSSTQLRPCSIDSGRSVSSGASASLNK